MLCQLVKRVILIQKAVKGQGKESSQSRAEKLPAHFETSFFLVAKYPKFPKTTKNMMAKWIIDCESIPNMALPGFEVSFSYSAAPFIPPKSPTICLVCK